MGTRDGSLVRTGTETKLSFSANESTDLWEIARYLAMTATGAVVCQDAFVSSTISRHAILLLIALLYLESSKKDLY